MFLKTQKHEYETVVIDSITEISEIIKKEIEKKSGRSMEQRDWGTLSKKIREILTGFRDLNMHVLFIALEKIEKDEDKVLKIAPSLNGKSADDIVSFMDVVGYLTIEQGTGERKILTATNSKMPTKDRTRRIGNNTEPNFGSWVEAVRGLEVIKEEEVFNENLDASGEIALEDDKIPAATPKTPSAPSTAPNAAPSARRAPEKKISDPQIRLVSSMIGELTISLQNDGDKLLKVVRKTILEQTEVDVGGEHGTVDEMLKILTSSQASKMIEYLKARIKTKREEKEKSPTPPGPAASAQ